MYPFIKYLLQRSEKMKKRINKKDAATIFNPVMYLVVLLLTAQLLILFVEYKRVAWVSGTVTNAMTDALLGACVLNEEELYRYGSSDELEILYPREKYDIFRNILVKELGLTETLMTSENSIALLQGQLRITDFLVYSVRKEDVTVYDFDEQGEYSTSKLSAVRGILETENGRYIEETTLVAEIGFTVEFMGMPVEVKKYHMVDVAKNAGR